MRIAVLLAFGAIEAVAQKPGAHWVATWATAQQLYRAPQQSPAPTTAARPPQSSPLGPQRRFGIPAPLTGLKNQTVRMIARTSIGGRSVRIRLSSAFGSGTVIFGAAHIAVRANGSAIVPGTDRALTFSGKTSGTLYAGATLVSDPVNLELKALRELAVSLYIPGETGPPTNHLFALHTTYLKDGDATGAPEIAGGETRESWYWLSGIDVLAPADAGALVTFGDSITDGDQSTPETDGMWPAVLAARLQANKATARVSVVNAGISGNRVLGDNASGLARFSRDALSQPGVRWISILEGINDITAGSRGPGAPTITADALIAAYRQIIETAHLYGVKLIGCTITPYAGSNVYNEYGESVRSDVNEWIRNSGAFDAIVDFDKAIRDSADSKKFRAEADSPDLLHPANPGYKLMGEAFDVGIFTRHR